MSRACAVGCGMDVWLESSCRRACSAARLFGAYAGLVGAGGGETLSV